MKTYTRQQNALIPSYALSYLVNGDASGLTDEDKNIIDKWLTGWLWRVDEVDNGSLIISPTGEDAHFAHYPEFGLPCDCVECDIIVLAPEIDHGR
jgi:hypothetical protein